MTKLRKFFWGKYTLDQFSQDEWEALCDGCAKCCLLKIVNKKKIFITNISCSKLELESCKCSDYENREILYKVLFDMKNDLTELKKITYNLIIDSPENPTSSSNLEIFDEVKNKSEKLISKENTIEIHESLSLIEQEKRLIIKALDKHKDRRKDAAKELGISERTLYRKLKEFEL